MMDYEEIVKEQLNNIEGIENLDDVSKGFFDYSFEDIITSTLSGEGLFDLNELFRQLKNLFFYEVKLAVIVSMQIVVICIITGMMKNLSSSFSKKAMSDICILVCGMVVVGISITGFKTSYQMSLDATESLVNTMEILAPILLGILISTGSVASGTVLSPILLGCITGFGIVIKKVILPLLFLSAILSLGNCLTEKNYVNKISKLLRNGSIAVSGILMTLLSCIINIQGLITDASDDILINTAKFSLGTFIPIVGGFTSDTLELFIKCMTSIKSMVGVFGIITLISLVLSPLFKTLIIAGTYKLTAAISEPIGDEKICKAIDDVGSCLLAVAAILFLTTLLFIIFLTIIMKLGGA